VIDKNDACPNVKGDPENNGCPWRILMVTEFSIKMINALLMLLLLKVVA
jgi:hypothetical protein